MFEFEAKNILRRYGVNVPRGVVIDRERTPDDVKKDLNFPPPYAVKSQVLVAGRGKAGGIKIVKSLEEALEAARELFGRPIKGIYPKYVLIEEAVEHVKEFYVAITIDRGARKPVVLASSEGGVDIEEIVKERPEVLVKRLIDPFIGPRAYEVRNIAKRVGLSGRSVGEFVKLVLTMYKVFEDCDAELVEINPLALIEDGTLIPLDARMIVDDNAMFRHADLLQVDRTGSGEITEFEAKAKAKGLTFVELEGDIGVMGNGAGITMATMDLIKHYGGRPANFLDIGGGASKDVVREAVLLLLELPKVKRVLVNVFGGLTRCDEVAEGIVEALDKASTRKPIYARLIGTNEEEGRRILERHGVKVYSDLTEAVIEAVRGG